MQMIRTTVQELMARARHAMYPHEKMQEPNRQTHYCYTEGPMYYLGQQIVKAMQDAGYPAKISECHRSAERQRALRKRGTSKAGPWESPHQYYEAVDIIHPSKGWNVSREYWNTLASCVRIVSTRYNVMLVHGHDWDGDGIAVPEDPTERFWDAAHIEIANWRDVRTRHRDVIAYEGSPRPPDTEELAFRFQEVLPAVWKRRPGV